MLCKLNIMYWFAIQIERCFETDRPAEGVRLYYEDIGNRLGYFIPKSFYYDEEQNLHIKGTSSTYDKELKNYNIQIDNPTSEDDFNIYHTMWENWDKKYGYSKYHLRSDYQPLNIKSISQLLLYLEREFI